MSTEPVHIVIVGSSLAGLTTAETLRDEGFVGRITLIGSERHAPYHRPMLSKQILSGERNSAAIRTDAERAALDITWELGRTATRLDPVRREVHIGDRRVSYDQLVIATGATARRPPFAGALALRTIDDALALRNALEHARRVAIIGAGVLGCEIASSTSSAGRDVTLLARGPALSLGALGTRLSDRISALLTANGVTVRTHSPVVGSDSAGLVLASGAHLPVDLVIAAIGCDPAVAWLRGSGLDLTDGVVCDSNGMAADRIWSVGDVAAWRDPATGLSSRVEHQQTAIEQAQAVARSILAVESSDPVTPFFWTTLFGTRILVHGRIHPDASLETIAGDSDADRFVLAARRAGRTEGLIGWNMPREFRIARAELRTDAEPTTIAEPTATPTPTPMQRTLT